MKKKLERNRKIVEETTNEEDHVSDDSSAARGYCEKVVPFFDAIRRDVDKLEIIVDDKIWPLPKYREMLFTK